MRRTSTGMKRLLKYWATMDKQVDDGGPGSGNWGHRGRPGLVGGSGKGGGKQYRGGRADIHYHSSKHDWLNGLKGEKQRETQKWIEEHKKDDKTGEQSIMENEAPDALNDRQKLLDLMAESRSWNETAAALVDENLNDDDKEMLNELVDLYGGKNTGGMTLPDESTLKDWDAEDAWRYQNMKSKAMGGPVIDKDAPKGLRKLGEPEPEPEPEFWWNKEENKRPPFKNQRHMMNTYADVLSGREHALDNIKTQKELSDLENMMFQSAAMGVTRPYNEDVRRLCNYLDAKADWYLKQGDEFSTLGQKLPGWNKLTSHEKDLVISMVNLSKNNSNYLWPTPAQTHYGIWEKSGQDRAWEGIEAFAKALGSDIESTKDTRNRAQEEAKREEEEKQKAAQRKKQERLEKYNQRRDANRVVIKGDSFSEKIDSMRKTDGVYTDKEINDIGKVVADEVDSMLNTLKDKSAELDTLEKDVKSAKEEYDKAWRTLFKDFETPEAEQEANKKWGAAQNSYNEALLKRIALEKEIKAAQANFVKDALKRIRKTGGATKAELKAHLPGRSSVKKFVEQAYEFYPSEWFQASIERGTITTKKTQRGHCTRDDNGEIAISGYNDDDMLETAVHELGHRFERSVPQILDAERAFYERRTQGEQSQRLRDVTGNSAYRPTEVTKVDKFTNPYMGKDYNGEAFELVSMGFEQAFSNPAELMRDRDYAQFIFGLLAVA